MSYLSALKEANEIIEILMYFKSNEDKLDEYDSLKIKYNKINTGGYITLLSFCLDDISDHISEFDYDSGYINYIPQKDNVFYESEKREYTLTKADYKDCSTEEGYFQKSTLYTENILDILVLLDCLDNENMSEFYLDTEYLEITKRIMQGENLCYLH